MAEIFERFVSNEYGVLEVIFREKEKNKKTKRIVCRGGRVVVKGSKNL